MLYSKKYVYLMTKNLRSFQLCACRCCKRRSFAENVLIRGKGVTQDDDIPYPCCALRCDYRYSNCLFEIMYILIQIDGKGLQVCPSQPWGTLFLWLTCSISPPGLILKVPRLKCRGQEYFSVLVVASLDFKISCSN